MDEMNLWHTESLTPYSLFKPLSFDLRYCPAPILFILSFGTKVIKNLLQLE